MGQTLSEPVTEKESAHCQNDEFAVSKNNKISHLFWKIYIIFFIVVAIAIVNEKNHMRTKWANTSIPLKMKANNDCSHLQ